MPTSKSKRSFKVQRSTVPRPVFHCIVMQTMANRDDQEAASSTSSAHTSVELELPPPLKPTTGGGGEERTTESKTGNSELQCYLAELKNREPLQSNKALQFWIEREEMYPRLSL
jgi:hypothetical protein